MLVDPQKKQVSELASEILAKVNMNMPEVENAYLEDTRTSISGINEKNVKIKYPQKLQFPIEIDMIFHDGGKSYVIYLTEINEDTLNLIMEDIYTLITEFLSGNYKLVKKKGFLFTKTYLEFNNPNLTYTTASPARRQ